MNVVEYDLDSSGGIMEQIQKLVAPPISDEAARRSRRRNRTGEQQRRHGRAVNHDCCDSCKEGGDLLCCDRCPAAFHLLCHDPPLTEDELPPGEWVCHRCRVSPEVKDDDAESTCSNRSARSALKRPAPPEGAPESEPWTSASDLLPVLHNTQPADVVSEDKSKSGPEKNGEDRNADCEGNPLSLLIKAARLMNPVQFELSKDIACSTLLPGTSKRVYGRYYKPPKKQAHELDNGLVPLPAKLCFTCTKSCRTGPLIQCDYCPLLFHMDCLNPPLTSLPSGRWMCPNHVEHFVDDNLVRTNSLTERVRLWERFDGMIDQHAVKIDFLKHVHRPSPPFRIKRKLPSRKSITVPGAVKAHYKNPPPLLPLPQKEIVTLLEAPFANKSTFDATPEEQEQWLSSVVMLQTSIAKFLTRKQIQKGSIAHVSESGDNIKHPDTVAFKPTASVAPVVQRDMDSLTTAASPASAQACDPVAKVVDSLCADSCIRDFPNCAMEQTPSVIGIGKAGNAISLLHGNLTSSGGNLNGEAEILDVQKAKSEAALRTRSNSADAAGVINVSWPGSDKSVGQLAVTTATTAATTLSPSSMAQSLTLGQTTKNIVISTINKANSTVVTKVLPGGVAASAAGSKVVLPPGVAARSIPSGSPASILSPRVLVQPAVQRVGSSPSQGTQTLCGPGSSAGTQTKVITVATSTTGTKPATVLPPPKGTATSLTNLPALVSLNSALQQWIENGPEAASDSELNKVDGKLLQLLAWQRLQQLLPPSSTALSLSTPNSSGKKGLLNGLLSPGDSEVRSRAVLCPLSGRGQAVPMPFRTLSMGTGADMDVQLLHFGHCNFVSSKHAVIFYDEMTRHFELLNYSDFGTTVDNVLYSCDFSEKQATTPQPSPVVAAVREIISKNGKTSNKDNVRPRDEKRYIMSARSREPVRPCSCKSNGLSLVGSGGGGAGWEGTAILHHGSYIRVGCLQFVFSIVDQAAQDVIPTPLTKQPEQMSLLKTHLKAAAQ